MLGNGIIEVLPSAEAIVSVPHSWRSKYKWKSGDLVKIIAGKKTIAATVRFHSHNRLSLANGIVSYLNLPAIPMCWKVNKKAIRFGPFVAAYCNHTGDPERPFGEITSLLQDMTVISRDIHTSFYVIAIGGFNRQKKTVSCWVFDETVNSWHKAEYPWPDFCFKKITYVPHELRWIASQESQFLRAENCGVFYKDIGSKWRVYQILRNDPKIRHYLPQTQKICSVEDIRTMLSSFPILYIKPARGTQGKSIYRLTRTKEDGKVQIESGQGAERKKTILKLTQGVGWFRKKFLSKRDFIVQQGIRLMQDPEGRSADFRWLVQKDGLGHWNITSRVARIGDKGSVTTNISTGADVLAASQFLQRCGCSEREIDNAFQHMDHLALRIVRRIEEKIGILAELGIDFGVDRQGRPWLIEVNQNPGRKMLRILDPEVRALSLRRPLEYARYTVGFGDQVRN